nr:site-specific integrase [Frigoribacterium sp. CG_9.8]
MTHEQLAQVAERCGQSADIVLFLAYTGVRWGEMAALKADRVDISRRRVEIAEAVSEPRGLITWVTPKSHERRSVPFPEFLTPRLRLRCEGKHPDDLVFVGSAGAVLRAGNFRNRVFDAAVASAIKSDSSITRVTLHDLRHTAASLAVSAGANVKAVQRMLGHASAAITLDVYADLFDDDLDALAEALNLVVPAAVVLKMCSTDPESEFKKP